MYYINLTSTEKQSKVLTLLNDLIEANKRGVKVKVILDNTMTFTDTFTIGDPSREDTKNKKAYEYLKDNSINVYYDDIRIYTHAKCIVIDRQTVIMGSTNWSEGALTNNNEISAIIKSKDYAKDVLKSIDQIQLNKEVIIDKQEYMTVSKDLMNSLQQMIENRASIAWDLYLYLILNNETSKEIELDYSKAINELTFKKKIKLSKKRYYVRRVLKTLDKDYKLLKYLNPEDTINNPKIIINRLTKENIDNFKIPKRFWEYNWHKRLTLSEQYCYFINLVEGTEYLRAWSMSLNNISTKYGLYKKLVTKGMSKLRHWNLLKIRYGKTTKGNYANRFPNMYRLNKLYKLEEWEKKFEKLKEKYGEEDVSIAIDYAKIVYCEKDLFEIENILMWMGEYGGEKVKEAFDIVKGYKAKSTSLKSMRYVKGILNNN